jgi:hypothetical protein
MKDQLGTTCITWTSDVLESSKFMLVYKQVPFIITHKGLDHNASGEAHGHK